MPSRCWIASGGARLVLFALYLGAVARARRWPYEVLNTTIGTPRAARLEFLHGPHDRL